MVINLTSRLDATCFKIFFPISVRFRIAKMSFVNFQLARLGPIMNLTSIVLSNYGHVPNVLTSLDLRGMVRLHLKDYHQKCFSEAQISSVISTACKRIPKPVQQEECFSVTIFLVRHEEAWLHTSESIWRK